MQPKSNSINFRNEIKGAMNNVEFQLKRKVNFWENDRSAKILELFVISLSKTGYNDGFIENERTTKVFFINVHIAYERTPKSLVKIASFFDKY